MKIAVPGFMADPALQAVLAALPQARLVGGCVRDALARAPVSDIDLATPQTPATVLEALAQAGLRGVPTGIAHGTVTAVSGGRGFEVTTLRRDVATDGRHAVVAFTDDWQADAARRDFTFNAMSLEVDGTLHDFFDGKADLAAHHVRFVGAPAVRVAEDRLRVLRYFRFYARYGLLPPDPATQAALAGSVHDLHLLSVERVWHELQRILAAPDPSAALRLMRTLGVLQAVLPEAGNLAPLQRMVAAGAPPDPMLRLAALVQADPAALATRLKMSAMQAALLADYQHAPQVSDADSDDTLRRLLSEHPKLALVYGVWLRGGSAELRARIDQMPVPHFPLQGRDVVHAGVPTGADVGVILRQVREWWLAGGCLADRPACLAQLSAVLG